MHTRPVSSLDLDETGSAGAARDQKAAGGASPRRGASAERAARGPYTAMQRSCAGGVVLGPGYGSGADAGSGARGCGFDVPDSRCECGGRDCGFGSRPPFAAHIVEAGPVCDCDYAPSACSAIHAPSYSFRSGTQAGETSMGGSLACGACGWCACGAQCDDGGGAHVDGVRDAPGPGVVGSVG